MKEFALLREMSQRSLLFISFVSLIILRSSHICAAALIASSKLEQCTNDGSTEALPCERKFTVALSIDGGQNNSEAIEFWRGAVDSAGRPYVLTSPVRISVAKSRPMIRYPVFYARNFNAKPREEVIYTGVLRCRDGAADERPTCGRAFDDAGNAIPFSEGFCCRCDACQTIGLCSADARANTDCSLFGNAAAASCLAFDPLWYSGYRLGPAETWYTMTVTIAQTGGTAATPALVMELGPDKLGGATAAFGGVTARLVGDFAAFRQPLNLESKFLFVPVAPANHPIVARPAPDEWMLVESHLVDSTGAACDRIGVSYEAFVGQGSRCRLSVGACLRNQLLDLRAADVRRKAEGHTPEFLVEGQGRFVQLIPDEGAHEQRSGTHATKRHAHALQATRPYIAYEVASVQASLITLTFVADNMSFVVNTASGEIVMANISDFAAGSRDGKLVVRVLNTGRIAADFHITVRNCSEGTFPISAQIETLQPLHPAEVVFDVRSEIVVGQRNTCNVSLYNSLFELVDSATAAWRSTDTIADEGTQGGGGNGASGVPVAPRRTAAPAADPSCTDCPFYNPLCFVTRRCFWQIIVQIALVIAVLAAIAFLVRHRAALSSCCCGGRDAGSSRREDRSGRSRTPKRRRHRKEGSRRAGTHPPTELPAPPPVVYICSTYGSPDSPPRFAMNCMGPGGFDGSLPPRGFTSDPFG